MSSILIMGMKMPKDVTLLAISPDGTVDIISGQPDLSWKTLKAKAVPVPPHGRPIDADALKDSFRGILFEDECFYKIDCAPTIIPAEEEEQK